MNLKSILFTAILSSCLLAASSNSQACQVTAESLRSQAVALPIFQDTILSAGPIYSFRTSADYLSYQVKGENFCFNAQAILSKEERPADPSAPHLPSCPSVESVEITEADCTDKN